MEKDIFKVKHCLEEKAIELLKAYEWEECKESIRYLFASICIVADMEADTYETDCLVTHLYNEAHFTEKTDEEEFYNYLAEAIV